MRYVTTAIRFLVTAAVLLVLWKLDMLATRQTVCIRFVSQYAVMESKRRTKSVTMTISTRMMAARDFVRLSVAFIALEKVSEVVVRIAETVR